MPRPTPAWLRLALAFFVGAWPAFAREDPGAVLTSAAAVRSLSVAAAAEARPVRLRGNLVLVTAAGTAMVLLERGEGIYVALRPPGVPRSFRLGDEIEVEGVSAPGDFAPMVLASRVVRVGAGDLPAPRVSTVAEINAGGLDAAWIELRGIVRACVPSTLVRTSGTRATGAAVESREIWLMTLAQGDAKMTVYVNGPANPAALVDAQVRLRAVVFNVHNANRQFVRANLQVPDASLIDVLKAPPPDPFARPVPRLADVLRFSRDGFSGHRVHVRGIVIGHREGQALWLREGDHGMRIASAQPGDLQPGDEVDVVGFPDHGTYTPSLSDAVFRKTASGPPPEPRVLRSTEDIARHDANLVQIYAELREVRRSADGLTLVLDWDRREVHAQTMGPLAAKESRDWQPGTVVRVAGICVAGQADYARPTGLWRAEDLQLWLRGAGDVAVLRPAPWLTPRRAVMIVLGVAFAALAALVVVTLVARRQLRQREEARKLAEVEFSAMLDERNRLARDIHDTLAQDLNAVSMQLELAKNASRSGVAPSAGLTHLGTAHQIVRKCLAEARESIWNMRSHILERNTLPEALQQVAEQLAAGGPCAVRTQVHGEVRRLAPAIENNLLRIGQEAVSNALRHARATAIELELHFEAARVRLVVRDDGTGFDPAGAPANGSHFGLRGMRERVAQMGGTFSVGPAPGRGTRVEVAVEVPG